MLFREFEYLLIDQYGLNCGIPIVEEGIFDPPSTVSKDSRKNLEQGTRIDDGDVISACVVDDSVRFYLNGSFQGVIKPWCKKPWRFAWIASHSSGAQIVSSDAPMGDHAETSKDGSIHVVKSTYITRDKKRPVKTMREKRFEKEEALKNKTTLKRDGEILVEFISDALLVLSDIINDIFKDDASDLVSAFREAAKAERRVKPHFIGSLRAAACSQVLLDVLSHSVRAKLRSVEEETQIISLLFLWRWI